MTDDQEARIMAAITEATAKIIAALAGTSRPTGGQSSAPATTGGSGARFGNYGQKANQPVYGAAPTDLEWYAKGCRRTLDDASKSKFHARERELLAAIEAELDRQNGVNRGAGGSDVPPLFGGGGSDDDVPFAKVDGRVQ